MNRFACVLVECFAAAAHERSEPALRDHPLAVVTGSAPARRVVDASRAAREEGVRPGITETEARARSATLVTRPLSEERVASARHALLEAALGVSPRVEDGGPGVVYVDLAGLARLHGGEHAIAQRLVRAARGVGLDATAGVAGSRTAARVTARGATRVTVVPPGEDRAALAPMPLSALDLPPSLEATFARWGIATLGGLAGLPREGLAMRLGPAGLRAQDEALGLDRQPFRPWTPPPFWQEAQGVDWEISSWDRLAPVLGALLDRLTARLDAAHLSADVLRLELGLATGGHDERVVSLACPLREPKPMLALIALELEVRPPSGPITRAAVSAHAVRAEPVQGGLGQRPSPALRDLAATLARLATLVGRDNFGSPVLLDSHRADAIALEPFAPPPSPERDPAGTDGEITATAGDGTAPLAFRRLRPPRRAEVETAEDGPVRVRFHDALGGVSAPVAIVARAGPWRTSGEWWDTGAWARDEWDVALADGMLCRLVRDRLTGAWFLDGAYD